MKEQEYDDQMLTDYLLGSLPDADAERFDELSFTDDDFNEALKSTENDLVDQYVCGELSGATLKIFETHYLTSPLRREKVEFARTLQIYAEQNSVQIKSAAVKEKKDGFFAFWTDIFNSKSLQIGFAAGLLLLFGGGLWLVNQRKVQPKTEVVQSSPTPPPQNQVKNSDETEIAAITNESIAASNIINKPANRNVSAETNRTPQTAKTPVTIPPKPVVATILLAPVLRGANQLKTISISKETSDVAAGLQLESDDYSSYRVVLTDETGSKNLWKSSVLKANGAGENKTLNIRFPAKLLKSQIYTLTVSGNKDGAAEIISNYSFRIVIK